MSWRKRLVLASAVSCLPCCATAQTASPIEVTQWSSGLTELNEGWHEHDGDKMEWSRPEFDEGAIVAKWRTTFSESWG
jgi:hypothetical protein